MKTHKQRHIPLSIVTMSDTHECHREVDVPEGDILIHCGDWTMGSRKFAALYDFIDWMAALPHKHKILCFGNHECAIDHETINRIMSSGTTVLLDGGITILGLRIWATAAIALRDSAYTLTDFPTRQIQYSRILPETDVLITHYPPYGVLDSLPGEGFHAGCPELRRSVDVVKPKLHLFGHAHGCHGILSTSSTTFANACLMGADNGIDYAPIVFRMKVEEK